MYKARKLNKIRKEMTKTFNRVLNEGVYTIEDVIETYAAEYGLQVDSISETCLALFEPGNENYIRCDISDTQGYGRVVLTTRKAPAPL